jgi:hypothetical protein
MQADPLQQLKDVHLPAEPSWWPPAPGWWLLALAALCLAALALRQLRRWQRRRRPYVQAALLHEQLVSDLQAGALEPERYVHEANALLKRIMLHARDEASAAALSGEAWLERLQALAPEAPVPASASHWLTERRFQPSIRALGTQETSELVGWFRALLSAARRPEPQEPAP